MPMPIKDFEKELRRLWDEMMLPEDDDIKEEVLRRFIRGAERKIKRDLTKE